ncbi:Thioredoxin superfamily protein isoform 3 [Gossypium australe]|uniref:Glutaredoxin-like protein n=1 Tax=Gossypium australe TaxID=47621 RepID=A0A5B6UJB1_9ROSI|nr:Thioredoxin superfamily protein isoform 3 [Gossypium australe]
MLSKGIGTMAARSLSIVHVPAFKPKWVFSPLSFCSSASKPRKLVLYSKPGCCLCDGLKEKLHAAFSLSGPDPLHDVVLQVRDITSNPEWEKAYQYEIPVLAKVLSDGSEVSFSLYLGHFKEILPRLSPRLGVELVHKKIAAAFKQFHLAAITDTVALLR